jgi:molybdenum cofactor synthesis domain-containing protein
VEALRVAGFVCDDPTVIPDGTESVARALEHALEAGAHVIVTTGGTGIAPRDKTPEGTARVVEQILPGVSEELRRRGAVEVPTAILTRGIAGIARGAFIVNLPGSPGGVASGMPVVLAVADHVLGQLGGADH